MALYGCNFYESLKIINQDFGLRLDLEEPKNVVIKNKKELDNILDNKNCSWNGWDIKFRQKFNEHELSYWENYGITSKTLKKYNVFPVKYALLDGIQFHKSSKENLVFGYFFEESQHIKLYAPFNSKSKKWAGDANYQDIQGLEQLNYDKEVLVITKSLKDVMLLAELGYEAIALNGEGYKIKGELKHKLKKIFSNYKHIYIIYDNDSAGVTGANSLVGQLF